MLAETSGRPFLQKLCVMFDVIRNECSHEEVRMRVSSLQATGDNNENHQHDIHCTKYSTGHVDISRPVRMVHHLGWSAEYYYSNSTEINRKLMWMDASIWVNHALLTSAAHLKSLVKVYVAALRLGR